MRRLVLSCILASVACGTEPRPSSTTPPAEPAPAPTETPTETPAPTPTEAVDVAAPAPQGGTAVHMQIVEAARDAKGVEKVKVRVDDTGAIVKLAVYHQDASRIPAPVQELAAKEFPGSKTMAYETEFYADVGEIFEVEVQTKDGKRCELAANAEGVLRYKECHVKPKDLPAEMSAKVKELHPKGKILEAETKQGPEIDETTIKVKDGGRELYLRMKPDGTLIQTLYRVPATFEVPAR